MKKSSIWDITGAIIGIIVLIDGLVMRMSGEILTSASAPEQQDTQNNI